MNRRKFFGTMGCIIGSLVVAPTEWMKPKRMKQLIEIADTHYYDGTYVASPLSFHGVHIQVADVGPGKIYFQNGSSWRLMKCTNISTES